MISVPRANQPKFAYRTRLVPSTNNPLSREHQQQVPDGEMMIRSRVKLLVATGVLALAIGLAGLAATAQPASAATWSGNYQGVAFGWTNDHAWAIASYATVATLGSGEIANLACNALGGGYGPVCDWVVSTFVKSLTAGSARLTNHGIWIAVYPHWGYVTWTGGHW